jgi:hypothetical protein
MMHSYVPKYGKHMYIYYCIVVTSIDNICMYLLLFQHSPLLSILCMCTKQSNIIQ